jgi:hypothetical protein
MKIYWNIYVLSWRTFYPIAQKKNYTHYLKFAYFLQNYMRIWTKNLQSNVFPVNLTQAFGSQLIPLWVIRLLKILRKMI